MAKKPRFIAYFVVFLTIFASFSPTLAQNRGRKADLGSFGPWGHVHSALGRTFLVNNDDQLAGWQFLIVDLPKIEALDAGFRRDLLNLAPDFVVNLNPDSNLAEVFARTAVKQPVFSLKPQKTATKPGLSLSHNNCVLVFLPIDNDAKSLTEIQQNWLFKTLDAHKAASRILLFMNKSLWLTRAGVRDRWKPVHNKLKTYQNLNCVYSRADGRASQIVKDSISYLSFGAQGSLIIDRTGPKMIKGAAMHIETVTTSRLSHTVCPFGAVLSAERSLNQEQKELVRGLRAVIAPETLKPFVIRSSVFDKRTGVYQYEIFNPSRNDIEMTAVLRGAEKAWRCIPTHDHFRVKAGKSIRRSFRFENRVERWDSSYNLPTLSLQTDVIFEDFRFKLQERVFELSAALKTEAKIAARSDSSLLLKSHAIDLRPALRLDLRTNSSASKSLNQGNQNKQENDQEKGASESPVETYSLAQKLAIAFELELIDQQIKSSSKAVLLALNWPQTEIKLSHRRGRLRLSFQRPKSQQKLDQNSELKPLPKTLKSKALGAGWHQVTLTLARADSATAQELQNLYRRNPSSTQAPNIQTWKVEFAIDGQILGQVALLLPGQLTQQIASASFGAANEKSTLTDFRWTAGLDNLTVELAGKQLKINGDKTSDAAQPLNREIEDFSYQSRYRFDLSLGPLIIDYSKRKRHLIHRGKTAQQARRKLSKDQ